MRRSFLFFSPLILLFMVSLPEWARGQEPNQKKDTCLACHLEMKEFLGDAATKFEADVHRSHGLGCADCHGGDPTAEDPAVSMSPARGFRGAPEKKQIPQFCARCHSDASYMQKFGPAIRVDQYDQYQTSVHGQRLKNGDTQVATCIDCHSVHDILAVSDPRSGVYPLNQASTCGNCHASAEHMASYTLPTDQMEKYYRSVHHAAQVAGDLSAPTCATCHGNHGAKPPGVESVANICGTCHVLFQQAFETSVHHDVFEAMGMGACIVCHENHEVASPGDDWLGVSPEALCVKCHMEGDTAYEAAEQMAHEFSQLTGLMARSGEILDRAERSGMEVSSARVRMTEATQTLIQARVQAHSFDLKRITDLTQEGAKIAEDAYNSGLAALKEHDTRRKGLAFSLIAIVLVIVGLLYKIREIERPEDADAPSA